jgi:pyrroline-5-carboxylate reductase
MVIGFIGLGNMAKAMIGGILKKQIVSAEDIIGSAATKETCDRVSATFGIGTRDSNRKVVKDADVIILAVKPQYFSQVIAEIMDEVDETKLVISIAAGKKIKWIESAFEKKIRLIRAMPNTPALVGAGCTAVCRNEKVSDEELAFAMSIFESFGKASVVNENLMDVVGGVSGSSPAYAFMFIEAMADAAVEGGMPRQQAYQFAAQSLLGSAKMVLETGSHPGELKDMVCSPGGTTIAAVRVLEEKGFRGAVIDAIKACIDKTKQL